MLEFFERQRAVVQGRGQAESIFDEHLLARAVAVPHAVQLRNGLMRFVNEQQIIARHVIQQRRRRLAGHASGEMPGIIFDAVAVADGFDHLQIEARALVHSLRFRHASLFFQFFFPPRQLLQNGFHRAIFCLRLHHVVRLGIDGQPRVFLLHRAEQRIDLRQRFHFVAEKLHPIGGIFVGRKNLDAVAAHPERSPAKIAVVALVQDLH